MRSSFIIISIIFLLGLTPLQSRRLFRPSLFNTSTSYVQELSENSYINWTEGFIAASASVPLPTIVLDRNHPDYGKPDTALSISEARERAREQARENAILLLMKSLENLPMDQEHSVRERMVRDGEFRYNMGRAVSSILTRTRRTGEGYVSIELALPFYQTSGLYSLFPRGEFQDLPVPTLDVSGASDRITGIVIDVSEFPEFRASLEPRFYSEQGRLVFGPEIASRTHLVHRGPVVFYNDRERAMDDRRLGIAPFYTFAAGVLGKNKSDLMLDSDSVYKILSSPSGRDALRNCAIVVVLKKGPS